MTAGKYMLCGLKEYERSILKRKIYILITTLNIHNLGEPQEHKTYMAEGISRKHF